VTVADLAIVAALVFGWGALSARLERFDVTAPITFVLAGLLTHGGRWQCRCRSPCGPTRSCTCAGSHSCGGAGRRGIARFLAHWRRVYDRAGLVHDDRTD